MRGNRNSAVRLTSNEQHATRDLVKRDMVVKRDNTPQELAALHDLRDGTTHRKQYKHTVKHGYLRVGTGDTETPTDGRVDLVHEPLDPEGNVVQYEVDEEPPDSELSLYH